MLKYLSVFCISLTIGYFAHAANTDEYYLRGNTLLTEGKYQKAIKAFDAFILSQKPDVNTERLSEAHYLKATAYQPIEHIQKQFLNIIKQLPITIGPLRYIMHSELRIQNRSNIYRT